MLPIIRTHTNDSGSLLNDSQQQQDYGDDYFYGHYGGEDGGGGVGDFRVEHYIWIVGGAVLLLLGSAGNALSLAVLTRPRMRRSNVSVYLMVVAVADLVSLYTGLLRHIIQTATGKDVRQHSAAMCKIHTTVVYFSLDLSAWLLAALSVERCISVKWPHRVKPHCTRMTSVGVITGLGLLLFAVNAHFFFLVGDLTVAVGNNQTRVVRCVPLSEEGYNFVAIVWPWLDLSLYALLPLIVHIVCNSIIVRSVLRSIRKTGRTRGSGAGLSVVGRSRPGPSMTNGNEKSGSRTRPSMMAKNPKSDNKLKLKTKQCQSGRSSSSERLRTPRARGSGGQQPSSEEHRVSSMTLMLVTVSTVFCLTTLPISLYTLINWIMVDTGYIHPYGQVTWAVLNVLMYTNHSINFLLYSLSGTRFRGQMTAMFRCQCFSKGRRSPRTHGHPHHQSRWSSFSSSSSYSMSMLSSSAPAVGSLQSTVHGRRWSSPSTQLGSCS
ncbi:hypothetical protein ACOMHN_046722 [Nucella lapillus]